MTEVKEKYNLLMAITMIVGICIGSGIFFKSDNILASVNGSIILGVLLFVLAAIAIIFGSLTIGVLAEKTSKAGGVITYAEEFTSLRFASGFGWFMTLVYYPAITAIVSWVVGVYIDILFNLGLSVLGQSLIGLSYLTICFIYNVVKPRLGAILQNSATFIKLAPLVVVGVLGLIYGNPLEGLKNASTVEIASTSFLTALGPIAYSFDGWIVSTSIAHEIKNSKKNLPLALTIAPLIILLVYVVYFVGVSLILGPEQVMALGDSHLSVAIEMILGSTFSKAITIFVIISVMGTVNGLVVGFIRMPYHLALRKGMFPLSDKLSQVNKKYNIPIVSAVFAYALSLFWLAMHVITMNYGLLGNSDVSEIAITVSYLFYIVLYLRVFKMYLDKEITSKFKGIFLPFMAILGSLIIFSGAIQISLFKYYLLFSLLIYFAGSYYYKKHA